MYTVQYILYETTTDPVSLETTAGKAKREGTKATYGLFMYSGLGAIVNDRSPMVSESVQLPL